MSFFVSLGLWKWSHGQASTFLNDVTVVTTLIQMNACRPLSLSARSGALSARRGYRGVLLRGVFVCRISENIGHPFVHGSGIYFPPYLVASPSSQLIDNSY